MTKPRQSTPESREFALRLFGGEVDLNDDESATALSVYGKPGEKKEPGNQKRTRRKGEGDQTPSTARGGGDKGGSKPPFNRGGGATGDAGDGDSVPNPGKGDSTPDGAPSNASSATTGTPDTTSNSGNGGDKFAQRAQAYTREVEGRKDPRRKHYETR